MSSRRLLLAVSALLLLEGALAARPAAHDGHTAARSQGRSLFGRRLSPQRFRRRFLRPPRVGPGKLYLAPLPIDGSEGSHLPNTIFLKRVSAAQTAPIMLPLAHGSARLGSARLGPARVGSARPAPLDFNLLNMGRATPAPLAVNRRGRRPVQALWRSPTPQRRQSASWVYPSAKTPLAPPGHWAGSSEADFYFEPFAERRSDRQPSGGPHSPSPRQRTTDRQPSGGPHSPSPSAHPLRKPNPPRARKAVSVHGQHQPDVRRHKKPTAADFRRTGSRRPAAASDAHTSVSVGASVLYPGSVSSADVTAGADDVIYDAAVDPQRAASRMTAGVGFRLPPSSVEYGGWKAISS